MNWGIVGPPAELACALPGHFQRESDYFSFENFPPRTAEAADRLYVSIQRLETLKPSFVPVTYGAGRSTGSLTHDLVLRVKRETGVGNHSASVLRGPRNSAVTCSITKSVAFIAIH